MTIYNKINELRIKAREKNIRKSGEYKEHGIVKYKYYKLEDIYDAITPILFELKITALYDLVFDKENGVYKGSLTLATAEDKCVFKMDAPFNAFEGSKMQPAQVAGCNNTYQAKYLWINALMLDDGSSDPDKGKR
jgi:hypothetical protein